MNTEDWLAVSVLLNVILGGIMGGYWYGNKLAQPLRDLNHHLAIQSAVMKERYERVPDGVNGINGEGEGL